jgi:hypothetical protein
VINAFPDEIFGLTPCKLTMHPNKPKVVYCKDGRRRGDYENVQFTFLGFTFRLRCAKGKDGKLFTSFLPAVSDDAKKQMCSQIRQWKIYPWASWSLQEIAKMTNRVM